MFADIKTIIIDILVVMFLGAWSSIICGVIVRDIVVVICGIVMFFLFLCLYLLWIKKFRKR